uniref:Uncharacterized protein n=1 Tax=Picea glauca TaxID=3330 RepID=A0A117NIL7_PICGL|nr:hypothetical protein ABT39_MTgene8 [Picea glauca]QHR87973.1 hypothetical protein Q903MT_gene1985 [Picea sitchensis]
MLHVSNYHYHTLYFLFDLTGRRKPLILWNTAIGSLFPFKKESHTPPGPPFVPAKVVPKPLEHSEFL